MQKLNAYGVMQLWHYFIVIIWPLFCVFILRPSGGNVVSQSLSDSCLNMKSVVNCSHRGIVYDKGDHSNYTSGFTCSVCCGGHCCEVSENISLKIVPISSIRKGYPSGNVTYSITLNEAESIDPNKSTISSNFTEDFSYSLSRAEVVHQEIMQNSSSGTSTKSYGTDSNFQGNSSVTNLNSEFENFTPPNIYDGVHCDNLTDLHHINLNIFSGFNGSYNYLSECPGLDEWSCLKWIDLSNNQISVISKSFGNNSLLEALFLKNNSISVIFPKFLNKIKSLKYLQLNDNPDIIDWNFLKEATNLNILDVQGSCDKVQDVFPISCSGHNITLITDSTSCTEDIANCTLLTAWPNDTIPGLVLSLKPCLQLENNSIKLIASILHTDLVTTQNGPIIGSSKTSVKLCASLDWIPPFLASEYNCIWISISGLIVSVLLGIMAVVAVSRWRKRIKRQGRYTRWLSVYSKKSSDNEHPTEVMHEYSEIKESSFCKSESL